jgi:3-hydroxyisobutyrate dehydrogenase-like beta-hydroxyacid dehydrogenase
VHVTRYTTQVSTLSKMTIEIGILHPGSMGISLAEQAIASGNEVSWCAEGRSRATRARAAAAKLVEMENMAEICSASEVLISVCPPSAAEDLADNVLSTGFDGIFVDANAISPQRSERIAEKFLEAGTRFVDGGIVGPPAIGDRRNYLYLSGPDAGEIATLFEGSQVTPRVLGEDYKKASAMKMCFASHSKGGWALTLNTLAAARAYGVMDDLLDVWENMGKALSGQQRAQLEITARKAWRFEGEMNEIADTLADVSLPDGIHLAAAELYHRLAGFKNADDVSLDEILKTLLK